ncbi:MAG TPA: hypothetical protein VI321_08375 [Burkholderiales bacterium]
MARASSKNPLRAPKAGAVRLAGGRPSRMTASMASVARTVTAAAIAATTMQSLGADPVRHLEELTLSRGSYAVTISADGQVDYRGRFYGVEPMQGFPVKVEGCRTKHLDAASMQRLKAAIERVDYFGIQANEAPCPDAMGVRTSVRADGKFRSFDHYPECVQKPEALTAFEDSVDRIVGTAAWVGTYEERSRLQRSWTAGKRNFRPVRDKRIPSAGFERKHADQEVIATYVRSAGCGNCAAAKRLAEIYDKGFRGIARDYAKSTKWYNTAYVFQCQVP